MDEVQKSIMRSSDRFSLRQDIKKLAEENEELRASDARKLALLEKHQWREVNNSATCICCGAVYYVGDDVTYHYFNDNKLEDVGRRRLKPIRKKELKGQHCTPDCALDAELKGGE